MQIKFKFFKLKKINYCERILGETNFIDLVSCINFSIALIKLMEIAISVQKQIFFVQFAPKVCFFVIVSFIGGNQLMFVQVAIQLRQSSTPHG